ncbi:hypothetical protein DSUL_100216 [Desulfovibrionales bacterium]
MIRAETIGLFTSDRNLFKNFLASMIYSDYMFFLVKVYGVFDQVL